MVVGGRTSQCQLPQWHPPGARGGSVLGALRGLARAGDGPVCAAPSRASFWQGPVQGPVQAPFWGTMRSCHEMAVLVEMQPPLRTASAESRTVLQLQATGKIASRVPADLRQLHSDLVTVALESGSGMRRCLIPQESSDRQLLTSSSCSTRTPRSAIRTIPTVTQRAKGAVRSAHTRGSIYQEAVHRTAPACVTRASRALPRSCVASFRCKFVAQGCGAAPNSAPTVSAVSTRLYLRSPCDGRFCSPGQGFLTVEDPSHDRNRW